MKGMREKTEGNVHVYPLKDTIKHETNFGAAGCYCEPTIKEIVTHDGGRIVRRVVLHQKLKGKPLLTPELKGA
mgnify:CR=1 FL=1